MSFLTLEMPSLSKMYSKKFVRSFFPSKRMILKLKLVLIVFFVFHMGSDMNFLPFVSLLLINTYISTSLDSNII